MAPPLLWFNCYLAQKLISRGVDILEASSCMVYWSYARRSEMVVSATWAWSTQRLHNRDARKGCFWWLPRADTRAPISAFTPHTSIKDSLIVNSTMYNQPILMPSEIFKVLRLKSQLITQLESFVSSWWSHFPEITSSFSAVLSTHFDLGKPSFLWASVDSQIGQIEMGIITVFAQAAQNLPLLSQESWPRHA